MNLNNPWLGVSVIALGLAAIVLFSWLKIPQVGSALAVLTLGIAILQGVSHQTTTKELVTLRKSMRPPYLTDQVASNGGRPPSLVDEYEKIAGNGPKEKPLSLPVRDPDKVQGK